MLTKEQKQYIKDNYLTINIKTMIKDLGTTEYSVYKFMKENNLIIPKEEIKRRRADALLNAKRIKPDEEKYIIDNIHTMTIKQIGKNIKRCPIAISKHLHKLGYGELLKKKKVSGLQKMGGWNKGKKMTEYVSEEGIKKIKKTMFKKGGVPPNKLDDWEVVERTDKTGIKYLYIKLPKKGLTLMHRYVYEKHYGKINKGYVVTFKDGDSQNLDPFNLIQISKQENMLRNSKIDYPEEVIPTIAAISELKNTIKNITNEK